MDFTGRKNSIMHRSTFNDRGWNFISWGKWGIGIKRTCKHFIIRNHRV